MSTEFESRTIASAFKIAASSGECGFNLAFANPLICRSSSCGLLEHLEADFRVLSQTEQSPFGRRPFQNILLML